MIKTNIIEVYRQIKQQRADEINPNSSKQDFDDSEDLLVSAIEIYLIMQGDQAVVAEYNEDPNLTISTESAFVNILNILDAESRTWPRKDIKHLSKGYEVIAANKYVLYGLTRSGPQAQIDIFSGFPRRQ